MNDEITVTIEQLRDLLKDIENWKMMRYNEILKENSRIRKENKELKERIEDAEKKELKLTDDKIQMSNKNGGYQERCATLEDQYMHVIFHRKMAIISAAFFACLAGFFGYAWHTNLSFA